MNTTQSEQIHQLLLLVLVILIADITHDFFQDILQRNQPCRGAILIQDNNYIVGGLLNLHHQLGKLLGFKGIKGLAQVIRHAEGRLVLHQQQVLDIDDAHHVVRCLLIDRKPGIMLLPEYLNQVIVTILNVNKHHINSGNHDILCNGVAQVEHVVNHLPFFRLNDSLFMAHIHNGPELILCDIVIFLIGVHMKGLKHNQRHPVNEDNKRGQHGHQNMNHMAHPK